MSRAAEIVRAAAKPAYAVFALLWVASVGVLYSVDSSMGGLALATAGYAALLGTATVWLLPRARPADVDDVFRFRAPSRANLTARLAVVLTAAAWINLSSTAGGGLHPGGVRVPYVTAFLAALVRVHTPLGGGLSPVLNFVAYALIPGALLLVLGTRPRELGLCRPQRGIARALGATLVLPAAMAIVALVRGGITVPVLFWLLVHNLLSNGFSEEFQARAMNLAALRVFVTNEWAQVTQCMLFALLHAGSTVAEYPGRPSVIVADVVALNAPMGLALGVMALRGRSLLLPSAVHVSLDTMARLVGAP